MADFRYSIKDLENFTQIKAHTIRIWEQRYGLLEPKRTETNIRYYNEGDLKKILNINLLYNSGYKISKIALLSESEIIDEAKSRIQTAEIDRQPEIDELTMLVMDFDGTKIKELLNRELEKSKLEDLYEELFLPFLSKIGKLWQVNTINIIHEHYFSNIFKEFLISSIEKIDTPPDPLKRALLFLNENEEHEFSILLYYYMLKKNGYSCHYFGQKVPSTEIIEAFNHIKPQMVVSTFTAKISEKRFKKVEDSLLIMSKSAQVIISGSQLQNSKFKIPKDFFHVKSINQLSTLLK